MRREICERLGLKRGDERADIRYCKCHETEVITRTFFEGGYKIDCKWNVPKNAGFKNIRNGEKIYSDSKGIASDRAISRVLSEVPMDDVDALKSINPTILKMAGLDAHAKVVLHNEKTKKHSLKRVISEKIERVKRVKK